MTRHTSPNKEALDELSLGGEHGGEDGLRVVYQRVSTDLDFDGAGVLEKRQRVAEEMNARLEGEEVRHPRHRTHQFDSIEGGKSRPQNVSSLIHEGEMEIGVDGREKEEGADA